MKKLFLFATVAAAGLFASCSSSDDAIADAGTAIENVDGDKAAIKIGLGNMVNTATRGTGTIGGVGVAQDHASNVWYGQSINVFMFNKIPTTDPTLTLAVETPATTTAEAVYYYNDREMITPGSTENYIPGEDTPKAEGEAMNADGSVKYYPTYGNFDFFGYHGDNALTGAVVQGTANDPTWTVPFTIDGSQDLMSAKAVLTTDQQTTMDAATNHTTDYFSAYSARKGVHPTLTFSHLLSRLQFHIKAGSASAAGYGKGYNITAVDNPTIDADTYNSLSDDDKALFQLSATPGVYEFKVAPTVDSYKTYSAAVQALCTPTTADGQDIRRAVKVKAISVESKSKGKLAVAWTGDKADYQKIVWDTENNDPIEMFLKERSEYKLNDGASITYEDVKSTKAAYDALVSPTDEQIAALTADAQQIAGDYISATTFDLLVDDAGKGQNKYTALTANQKYNAQLVTLTPKAVEGTSPIYTTDAITSDPVQIGEALIIAPNTTANGTDYTGEALTMHVTVAQMVPTDWRYPNHLEEKELSYELTIPVPTVSSAADAFRINHSYNVNLTIYSLERILVLTTISEWENGGNRQVGGDDDTDWSEHPNMTNDPD